MLITVSAWSTYAVAGILQGALLVMCIMWRARQRKLGIDDFGNPIHEPHHDPDEHPQGSVAPVTQGPAGGVPVREAISAAVQTDVHVETAQEDTPLLKKDIGKDKWTWFNWSGTKRR